MTRTRPNPSASPSAPASSPPGAAAVRLPLRALLALLALVLVVVSAARDLAAQRLPEAVVAVVDYQRLLSESKAAQSIRAQIEARRKRYQEEISAKEQELLEQDRELSRQRALLSPEAFQQRRRAFEEEAARVQRLVQQRRRELDTASAQAYAVVRDAILEIIGGMAESRGFNLVLPSSTVLLFSPKLDLTEEVLEELNRRLPEVKVPPPGN